MVRFHARTHERSECSESIPTAWYAPGIEAGAMHEFPPLAEGECREAGLTGDSVRNPTVGRFHARTPVLIFFRFRVDWKCCKDSFRDEKSVGLQVNEDS